VDLYTVLQVERTASARQIRSAYRRLARAYHPDRNAAPDAAEQFRAVAEAYAILSDTGRRASYDRWGLISSTTYSTVVDSEELAFE
jgi:curved DNA-binding protein CbpA